jgi:hypothetical protein
MNERGIGPHIARRFPPPWSVLIKMICARAEDIENCAVRYT